MLVKALKKRVASYNNAMDLVEREEALGNALIIRPSMNLGVTRMEKSLEKLKTLYQLGIDDGKTAVEKIRLFKKENC